MRYIQHTTLPSKQTHTQYLNPVPTSFLSPPSLCFSVCLFSLQHTVIPLSCLCPFCMCELRSPRARGQPIPSFFFTCSQIPSLSQAGIVPQLIERESWGKLWWVIINQPAMKTSRYSKASGFSRTTAQKSITSCSFWSRYCI